MDPIDLFLAALLSGLSFLLLVQMLIAYRRVGNMKLILLAIGFMLLFVEGMLLVLGQVWLTSVPAFQMSTELLLLNLIIVFLLYVGTVKG